MVNDLLPLPVQVCAGMALMSTGLSLVPLPSGTVNRKVAVALLPPVSVAVIFNGR